MFQAVLMDSRLSTTFLPGIWVIETLARSNQIAVSLLLDLLEKFPQTSDDIGRNARELVSFRILESLLFQGAHSNSLTTSSSPKIAFDQSKSCEDVLQQILLETPASNLKADGPEMWRWDVQSFIALKRSTLDNHILQQLKGAILTGSHSFLASLIEQSGLPFGHQPKSGFLVNGDKRNGIMTDSNTCVSEGHDQLISPAITDSNFLLHSDKPNENLLPVKEKRSATIKVSRGKPGKNQIISKNGSKDHTELSNKYENDIIHCDQGLCDKLSSSVVNKDLVDAAMMIGQYSKIERCGLERSTNVQETGPVGPPDDDDNGCTSLKEIGSACEVLHCKNNSSHCDTELPNDKSDDEHGHKNEITEAKRDKEGTCDLKSTIDMDRFEPHIKDDVQNGDGEGKIQDLHCDTKLPNGKYGAAQGQKEIREATNDKESFCYLKSTQEMDKFGPNIKDNVQIEREEGIHMSRDGQCRSSRYCLAANCSGLNLLAYACSRLDEESLGYSSGNRNCIGSLGQDGPPGDVDGEFTSSKGVLGHDKEMHNEEQVSNHSTKQDHENGNAGDSEGVHEPKTTSRYKDRFEQEFHCNVTNLGNVEGVDVSGDSDGCHDERADIATKKNAFLSSQCTFSQGSVDCRELNVCVKCNKGGKLMICSTNSCRLVVHESCLGSHVSLSTRGKFLCPFCAYSQGISEYMDMKRKVCLARNDFTTFVCFGARKELKKRPRRSYRLEQHHLEHDGGLHRSIEPNDQDNAKHINSLKRRRTLEYEEAGCSTLRSGDISPFGGKTVDSTNDKPHPLNRDKKDREKMRQMPKSMGAHGQNEMAASTDLRSKGGNASDNDPQKKRESKSHVIIRSRNRVFRSPETHLVSGCKSSPHNEAADRQKRSEENDNFGVSKYPMRVQKHKRQIMYPEIPKLRRIRLPWTTAEEDKLKEGMLRFCSPHENFIPWKKIMEFGADVFEKSRSTTDLKDKWRNICRGSPKS